MPLYSLHSEKDLLLLIAQGDEQAFSSFVDRYSRKVFIHLLTFVKHYEAAEELSQDIFLKIWNHRHELPNVNNFSDYLFIVSRNHLVSYLRKKLPKIEEPADQQLLSESNDPQSNLEVKELSMRIEKGILNLRPQQQKIFRMSREEGLTYQQIAQQLNISQETVKWHLAEALNSLRIYFREHGDLLVLAWMAFETTR